MIGANGNETVLKTFKRTFECMRVGIACGIKKKHKVICPDIPCAPRPMASTRTHNDEFVERKLIMTRKGCQGRSIYVLFPFRTRSLWAHIQLFSSMFLAQPHFHFQRLQFEEGRQRAP